MKYRQAVAALDFAWLHQCYPDRYPFLLESVAYGTDQSRYDVLLGFPQQTLVYSAEGELSLDQKPQVGDFLSTLEQLWRTTRIADDAVMADLPFRGGWFFFLGYEMAVVIEPSLSLPESTRHMPRAYAARIPAAWIYDHEQQQLWCCAEDPYEGLLDIMQVDANALAKLDEPAVAKSLVSQLQEEPGEVFLEAVAAVKAYIQTGDVFQVNLSRLWQGSLNAGVEAIDVYRALRQSNPAPFAGLAKLGEQFICSSSPERLVSLQRGLIQTRPIAGTHPRSASPAEDQALAAHLLAHPKERAEHIMLIDLERNDLGRICTPGTVRVSEFMQLETYAHVHHIVSNVVGELRQEKTPIDVLRATFPGGTITGCPKVRCMEIIAELEASARCAYTGSMGYINHDGSLDSNILIRTIEIEGRQLYFRAGAGIVHDSDAERELAETRAKAKGLIRCLS